MMKKMTALFLALFLVLTTASVFAEGEGNVINWTDVEPYLAESELTGEFVTLPVPLKMWIPNGMLSMELTEEFVEAGYVAYFLTEDQSCHVGVMCVDGDDMDLAAYAEALPEYGATEVEMAVVNGLNCITYQMEENDTSCMTFISADGYFIEFAFAPVSMENFNAIIAIIAASIQAA